MAQFTTKTTRSVFNTESVVIDREAAASNPVLKAWTVLYSGACDFQSGGGTQYHNPSGVVDIADAWLSIDPDVNGNLPPILTGDRATVTQSSVATVYNVQNVSVYTFPIAHVELLLRRGPAKNENR